MYGTRINFVSPDQLRFPADLSTELTEKGAIIQETTDLDDVLAETDVLYVTRVQKERFGKGRRARREYERLKNHYIIDEEVMSRAGDDMILMHPLPRVGEIVEAVDSDPRAIYFDQVENGMHLRMGLWALVFGRTESGVYIPARQELAVPGV
jgi:aspartate carbamoyltransferase catalytic subunit